MLGKPSFLVLEARFLASTYGGVEWPPAPFRLLQAIVAGNQGIDVPGLAWMEQQGPPFIVATDEPPATAFNRSIPNNSDPRDKTTTLRRVIYRRASDPVRYCFVLHTSHDHVQAQALIDASHRVHTLGVGEDMCGVTGYIMNGAPESAAEFHLWVPQPAWPDAPVEVEGDVTLQVGVAGSLRSLEERFQAFQCRLNAGARGYGRPVSAPALHELVPYRRSGRVARHAVIALRLVDPDEHKVFRRFRAEDAIVVGGLLRHAAMQLAGKDDQALQDFAAGYGPSDDRDRRMSWVPLPSVGHEHADGLIRRGLWLARAQDASSLAKLATRVPMAGVPLVDEHTGEVLAMAQPVVASTEPVLGGLLRPSREWSSITPVILPGDHGAGNLRLMTRLMHKAVRESGIDPGLIKHLEFSTHGFMRQTARLREVRLKQWHAKHLILYHVRVRFREPIRGPIVLGRGRHFGLGLMCANPE